MPAPTVTALPTAPQRTDAPTTFSTRADAWVAAIATFVSEVNSLASYLDALDLLSVRTETASFQLDSDDNGAHVKCNHASGLNVTVPSDTTDNLSVGFSVSLRQIGAGQITVVADSGVTIDTPETLISRKQHSTITLVKEGANQWAIAGDLELA